MAEWTWKGRRSGTITGFSIDVVEGPEASSPPLRYRIQLEHAFPYFAIRDEVIEPAHRRTDNDFLYRWNEGRPLVARKADDGAIRIEPLHDVVSDAPRRGLLPVGPGGWLPSAGPSDAPRSVLSTRRDIGQLPQITLLAFRFSQVRLFRTASTGAGPAIRGPQRADQPFGFLLEDGSNLGMVLNDPGQPT
jgi:hypothetical protein